MTSSAKESEVDVALVVIARNEERCIERCLKSAAPHVDDMLVLDTGSTDRTQALAQQCGARVRSFTWVDDFAAARNASLEGVTARWALVLDADEWLDDSAAALRTLTREAGSFVGAVNVRSLLDPDPTTGLPLESSDWISRVLPRGVRYAGRIHESPAHSLPVRRLPITVWHDGYLVAQRDRKAGRNLTLLQQAVVDHPGDSYFRYQLAREQEQAGEQESAKDSYLVALRERPAPSPSWRDLAVVNAIHFLGRAQYFDEGLALIQAELPHFERSVDFWFVLGGFFLELASARPDLAPEFMPNIEQCYLRCLELGEQPQTDGAVRGRGSFLAARNLYAYYTGTGNTERAEFYRRLSVVPDP